MGLALIDLGKIPQAKEGRRKKHRKHQRGLDRDGPVDGNKQPPQTFHVVLNW